MAPSRLFCRPYQPWIAFLLGSTRCPSAHQRGNLVPIEAKVPPTDAVDQETAIDRRAEGWGAAKSGVERVIHVSVARRRVVFKPLRLLMTRGIALLRLKGGGSVELMTTLGDHRDVGVFSHIFDLRPMFTRN